MSSDATGSANHLPGCFACGALNREGLRARLWRSEDRSFLSMRSAAGHEGAPGLVHGGVLAALLDDLLGAVPELRGLRMTASLDVRFVAPVELGRPLEGEAWLVGRTGRRVRTEGVLHYADDPGARTEASATFVLLDPAAALTES